MNDAEWNELRETGWKRPLNAAEEARVQAWLAARPEDQAAWEEETGLSLLLHQLPQAAVSSNFTARVLREIDSLERSGSAGGMNWLARLKPGRWLRPRWAIGFASALTLVLGLAGLHVYRDHERKEIVSGVRMVGTLAALPHPEALQDFEAIHRLSAVPPTVDLELLAALE